MVITVARLTVDVTGGRIVQRLGTTERYRERRLHGHGGLRRGNRLLMLMLLLLHVRMKLILAAARVTRTNGRH